MPVDSPPGPLATDVVDGAMVAVGAAVGPGTVIDAPPPPPPQAQANAHNVNIQAARSNRTDPPQPIPGCLPVAYSGAATLSCLIDSPSSGKAEAMNIRIISTALGGLIIAGSLAGTSVVAQADTASTAAIVAGAAAIAGALLYDSNNHPYYVRDNHRYYVTQNEAQYYRAHHQGVERRAWVPEQSYPVARDPYHGNMGHGDMGHGNMGYNNGGNMGHGGDNDRTH
jgi:hypothetical protein